MMTRRILILLLTTSLLFGCAKIKVDKIPANTSSVANGVIYALPNTVVRVQAKVDKAEKTGAPYAIFAAIFAPGKKPVCKDKDCTGEKKVEYSLQDTATFATYGEPDPNNVFLVKFSGGGAIDQKLSMTWNEAGLLSAASAEVTNRTVDIALSAAKLVTGLGAKAALGAGKTGEPDAVPLCDVHTSTDVWVKKVLWDNGGPLRSALIANYCAIDWVERVKFVQNQHEKPLIEATRKYVDFISPLIEARKKIIEATSNVPIFDPVGMLTRIESEIDERLKTLYVGSKKTATAWEGLLDVRTIADGTELPILRIDPEKGICPGDAEVPPASKPIPKEILLHSYECSRAVPVNLTLSYYPERHKQLFTKLTDITTGERSFRYRIPAQMRATLYDNSKTYGVGTFQVAQLGTVISLPATRQSKNLSYDLAFIESTGALKTFKLGAAGGLDASTIDALSGIGGNVLDARSALRKKEDEVTVLTRQLTLLKLRDDICTLQKKNGLECTVEP